MFGTSRSRNRNNQNKTKLLVTFGIIAYLLIGTIIFPVLYNNIWDEFDDLRELIIAVRLELLADIKEVNDTLQSYIPCLDLVCTEFPPLIDVVMIWGGCWNTLNNTTPDGSPIVSGVGENGKVYRVCVGSTNVTNIDGHQIWGEGDLIIFDGNVSMWLWVDGSPELFPNATTITDSGAGQTLLIDDIGPAYILYRLIEGNGVYFDTSSGTGIEIAQDTIGDNRIQATGIAGINWVGVIHSGVQGVTPGNYTFVPNVDPNTNCVTNYIRKGSTVFQDTRCTMTGNQPFDLVETPSNGAIAFAPYFARFEQCINNGVYQDALNATGTPRTIGIAHLRCGKEGTGGSIDIYETCAVFSASATGGPCIEFQGQIPTTCISDVTPGSCTLELVVSYRAAVPLSSFVCC